MFHQAGSTVFAFNQPAPPVPVIGSWANVDGRLGIIAVAGSGLQYTPAKGYHPGLAVAVDVLYASASNHPKHFPAGAEVAHRIVVFLVDVDPKKTARLTQSLQISNQSGAQVLHFKLPEGGKAAIPLL